MAQSQGYKDYKQNIWKLYAFNFFSNFFLVGGVLVPFFTDWGKISFAQIMLLQAWFGLWVMLLNIPTGAIADHIGRKKALILSALFHIAFVIVYTSTPNFYMFMLGEVIAAVSVSLLAGAQEALVYDTMKNAKEEKKSKKVFGNLYIAFLLGIMFAAPAGSIIAAKFGLRAPMLLMTIPFSIAAIIALTFKETETKRTAKRRVKDYIHTMKEGIAEFHNNKTLKILAFDTIAISTIAYFIIWLYQPMLKQAGIGIAYFGIVYAALVLSQIISIKNFERIEKLLGSKEKLLFLSAAIMGIMLIIGGLTTFVPAVLLAIIIGGGLGLSRGALFTSYMNKHIESAKRATVLSVVYTIGGIVGVAAKPVVGFMTEWSLNYTLIILGAAAIIFALVSKVEEEHLIE